MFWGAAIFNEDISTWNTQAAVNFLGMFEDAYEFNQDISGWDVSKVCKNLKGSSLICSIC
jgi:surface protein